MTIAATQLGMIPSAAESRKENTAMINSPANTSQWSTSSISGSLGLVNPGRACRRGCVTRLGEAIMFKNWIESIPQMRENETSSALGGAACKAILPEELDWKPSL
jgi:hypothetical protein